VKVGTELFAFEGAQFVGTAVVTEVVAPTAEGRSAVGWARVLSPDSPHVLLAGNLVGVEPMEHVGTTSKANSG
jgi:hypothetical protein